MAKKIETKVEKIEREYVIPLRDKCRPVPRYKKTPKAVKTVKEFVARHMKVYDKDLNKIKLDMSLNEVLWQRGIKKPVHKVKVKVVRDGENVKVSLVDIPEKIKFKLARAEKREKAADEVAKKKKAAVKEEKPEEKKEGEASKEEGEDKEDKKDSKEKIVKDEPKKTKEKSSAPSVEKVKPQTHNKVNRGR